MSEIEFLENKEKEVKELFAKFMKTCKQQQVQARDVRYSTIRDLKGVIREMYSAKLENANYQNHGIYSPQMCGLIELSKSYLKIMKELE